MWPQLAQQNQSRTAGVRLKVLELAQRGHTIAALGSGPVSTTTFLAESVSDS
jgi:hypothetical protein